MGCRTCGTTSRAGRIIEGIISRTAGTQSQAMVGAMGAAKAKPPAASKKKKTSSTTASSKKKTSSKS